MALFCPHLSPTWFTASSEPVAAILREERQRWGELIKTLGIQVQ